MPSQCREDLDSNPDPNLDFKPGSHLARTLVRSLALPRHLTLMPSRTRFPARDVDVRQRALPQLQLRQALQPSAALVSPPLLLRPPAALRKHTTADFKAERQSGTLVVTSLLVCASSIKMPERR